MLVINVPLTLIFTGRDTKRGLTHTHTYKGDPQTHIPGVEGREKEKKTSSTKFLKMRNRK